MIKLLVSIFGQPTGYRIYTVSREPIRLLEIQYPVFPHGEHLKNDVCMYVYTHIYILYILDMNVLS